MVWNGIQWKGKISRVSVLKKGESGMQKTAPPKKVLVQRKKEEVQKGGQQLRKASFSFVICYNCGSKAHAMKSCSSASRAVSKKIERKAGPVDKGKNKMRIIDDDRFTKVVNI